MQIHRLFEILYLLLERGSVTSAELAERFEVSTRTIYRDVELLSGAGIPVYASRGRNGGISLLDRFVLDRSLFSAREQDEILFALQSLHATRADRNGELLCRLSAIFRRESPDWIDVDFSGWGSGEEEKEKFRLLKDAILEREIVGFTYYSSRGEKSERRVEPAKLNFKNGWYLQGFCLTRQGFRTFKVRRMEGVRLAGQGFEPRSGLPPLGAAACGPQMRVPRGRDARKDRARPVRRMEKHRSAREEEPRAPLSGAVTGEKDRSESRCAPAGCCTV